MRWQLMAPARSHSSESRRRINPSKWDEGGLVSELLNFGAIALIFFGNFKAEPDGVAGALHEGRQVFGLGVAARQGRDGRHKEAVLVVFDNYLELGGGLGHAGIIGQRKREMQ